MLDAGSPFYLRKFKSHAIKLPENMKVCRFHDISKIRLLLRLPAIFIKAPVDSDDKKGGAPRARFLEAH